MKKHIAATWIIAVLLCTALASLLLAEGGVAPFSITLHDPPAHEVGVALAANVQATFDDDVNAGTVTNDTFVVHGHLGGLASGTFGYDAGTRTVTLDPGRPFHAGEVLRVSATSGIASSGGAPLTPYGWQFTAGGVYSRSVEGFTAIGAGLTGVLYSSAAWGDYDNDSDLDILLTGARLDFPYYVPISKVYRNDGGAFIDILAGLYPVYYASAAWGDYDNDGDLDFVMAGWTGMYRLTRVYRNDGGGTFTNIEAALTAVRQGSVAWGDYDNDGDLDFLLTGSAAVSPYVVSKIYRNDGNHLFHDSGAGLTAVVYSSVAWGDYDNDGDLDILLAGMGGDSVPVSKVYRNDGDGGFVDTGAALTGVSYCSVAWGDYDNDGDLDILLTGHTGSSCVSNVYRNDGGGVFADIGAGLTGVSSSSAAWGDVDNDGDLDILLTGHTGTERVSKVYRNDGASGFSDIGAGLTPVDSASVAWGDYDNDGDLDTLLTGSIGSAAVSNVYRNNSTPQLGTVAPSSGSGATGATTYFTTTWTDPDGWQNLKHAYFHVGDSPSIAGNVTLLYNAAKDKLWLRSDDGTVWTGGYAPCSANTMENGQAILDCSQTTTQGDGDTLAVTWALEFKAGFEGSKKLGLKCKDRDRAKAKGKWKGTWTIE